MTSSYEEFLLALCIWRESRGSTVAAQRGIAAVVRNRVRDGRWPDTVPGVILQPLQFSSFRAGDPNAVKFPQQERPCDWQAWQQCLQVARELVDWLHGANHYHSEPREKFPDWHDDSKVVARIGPFYFLAL